MNWTTDKSVALSRFFVIVFTLLLAAACIAVPWFIPWFLERTAPKMLELLPFFFTTAYTTAAAGAGALYLLYRLLANLRKEQVFVPQNVQFLRMLSWCCFLAAVIFLLSGFYYLPFFLAAAAAAFMGLILRVVKNAFQQAVVIKEENDFTI